MRNHVRQLPLLLAVTALLLSLGLCPVHGQERGTTVPRVSPNAVVGQTVGVTEVKMTYGRPSVRDREIFGGLVPYGKVWRTGANETTSISFSTPVRIEGEQLDAGTYGFFTIPGPEEWTLIFNKTAEQWGAYNYNKDDDALRVTVESESAPMQEMLTVTFRNVTDSSATGQLHWANTRVPFDIAVNTTDVLRSRAREAVTDMKSWKAPLPYVGYALQNEVMLDDALTWINRSIELEKHFDNVRMKAYVLAATGQHKQAVEVGTSALDMAESMDEAPNGVNDLREKVNAWESKI